MCLQLQNLKNKLSLVGATLVVLGSIIVLVAWVALFICAGAILIKAVVDHAVSRVQIMTKKGFSKRPRPHSRKPDVVPTPALDEEYTKVSKPLVYETAEDLAERLQKVRDALSKKRESESKETTDTTSEAEASTSKAAKVNYKYVTADLKHQLHGIRYQGSRSHQKVVEKDELQAEQAAQTSRQRLHGDEAKTSKLVHKAAVADLHAPNASSEFSKEEDWIDADDETSGEDDVIEMCPAIEKKPCTDYIIPRLMPKESTKANNATNKPSTSFDDFKARQLMRDKSIMSYDEFAARYYKTITANEGNVSTDDVKGPRIERGHRRDEIGEDTPMGKGKTTGKNYLYLTPAELLKNLQVEREKRRNRSGIALPLEEGKKLEKNGADMALERDKKASQSGCLFLNLPAEIRNLIYSYVLTTPVPIRNAGELVEQMAVGLVVADEPDPSMSNGIDAALMRTCRGIYTETLPVLYGENIFHFKNVEMLKKFRNTGLVQTQEQQSLYRMISTFNLQANANGRLSAIRKLSLNLTAEAERMLIIRPGNRAIPSRTRIVHEWGSFLHQDRRGILGYDYIDFPMLGFLSLDFSDWCLGENEGLVIRPFVDKFRTTKGLRKLVVKGLCHEKSLAQLKKQLLREGGIFEVHQGD